MICIYYNGGFRALFQIAHEAIVITEDVQEPIDHLEIGGRNYVLTSDNIIQCSIFSIALRKATQNSFKHFITDMQIPKTQTTGVLQIFGTEVYCLIKSCNIPRV